MLGFSGRNYFFSIFRSDQESDSVIHDITGTTVYVVGVICIIPAAGLVAWIVRYVVKRRVLPNSENGSETGKTILRAQVSVMYHNFILQKLTNITTERSFCIHGIQISQFSKIL